MKIDVLVAFGLLLFLLNIVNRRSKIRKNINGKSGGTYR